MFSLAPRRRELAWTPIRIERDEEDPKATLRIAEKGRESDTYVVDQTVLGRVVLGFERSEEGLLGSEDLDGGRGVLGKVKKGSGVGDESGSDELSNEGGEVGRDGGHSVAQVLVKLGSVLGDGDDLVAKRVDVRHVGVGNLGSHRKLGSGLEGGLKVLGEDGLERGGRAVGSETWGEWLK